MDSPTPLTYKPSSFYFRRALRQATECDPILKIVRALQAEIELCYDFARSHGIYDCYDGDGGLFALPDSFEEDELRSLGLQLCCRLEESKQTIRDHGLIPPKRHIMTSEARDKGWELGA